LKIPKEEESGEGEGGKQVNLGYTGKFEIPEGLEGLAKTTHNP